MTGRRSDRGSAVPFAVACLGVLLLLGAAMGVVGALVVAHRKAQSAADLAALAGASAVQQGASACAAAGSIATANGAGLTDCSVAGEDVTVVVTVGGPHWLGQLRDLSARSRAGPGDPSG